MSAKRPLKIALVSDSVLPFHNGGKEERIDQLGKGLVGLGHDVHVYTMKWWDGPSKTYAHGGMTYHALCRLHALYSGERRSFKEGILFGLATFKMIRAHYDVLEVDHMPYFPLFAAKIVSLLKRKPFFATWHEAVGVKAWRDYIGFIPGTIAYCLERLSVMMPDHIIAVSEHTRRLLKDELHYSGSLSLVQNGINYPAIEAAPVGRRKSDIVYAGRLVKHKNVDMLIDAVARLKPARPDIKAFIIGGGPEAERLQAHIDRLGLKRNVIMLGRLPEASDVYSYMKASKLFVTPSTREGFGITVLEAYACGLRVVTVRHQDNAGQYLVKRGTGIVCEPTVEEVATSIDALLNANNTKLTVDAAKFDWSQRVRELQKAYNS